HSAFDTLARCVIVEDDTGRVSRVDRVQIMVVPSLVVTGNNRTDFVLDQEPNSTTTVPRRRTSFVLRTDNKPRVRYGYASKSTPGHARDLAAHHDWWIGRTNVTANDRACAPVPMVRNAMKNAGPAGPQAGVV